MIKTPQKKDLAAFSKLDFGLAGPVYRPQANPNHLKMKFVFNKYIKFSELYINIIRRYVLVIKDFDELFYAGSTYRIKMVHFGRRVGRAEEK